jgi:hypothetical protein
MPEIFVPRARNDFKNKDGGPNPRFDAFPKPRLSRNSPLQEEDIRRARDSRATRAQITADGIYSDFLKQVNNWFPSLSEFPSTPPGDVLSAISYSGA